jgi:hypothetical protein
MPTPLLNLMNNSTDSKMDVENKYSQATQQTQKEKQPVNYCSTKATAHLSPIKL